MKSESMLRRYLELRSKQLRLDLDAATLFTGSTEVGSVAEDSIRRFLKSSLPARYSIGLGEVISSDSNCDNQTQAKDVIIYDSAYSPIFGWGETGFHLFPVESVFAVIEVKKTIETTRLLTAINQATEVKPLSRKNSSRPFTAVIAFESETHTETLAKNISQLPSQQRVDFVLIVNPKLSDEERKKTNTSFSPSDYIAHWHYDTPDVGSGKIDFVTAHDAACEEQRIAAEPGNKKHIYLTWGRSEHALMWFYLFLITSINAMGSQAPNLWEYTRANQVDLGYIGDSSGW